MQLPRDYRRALTLAAVLAAALPQWGWATNGYLAHGYGNQSKGAAGVAAALPQDALVIATNPAGLLNLESRLDLGIDIFLPDRKSTLTGNAFGPDETFSANDTDTFIIPEFGYNRKVSDRLALGLAIYGNGGINTNYENNPFARFGATGEAGVDLKQVFVAPAVAIAVGERSQFGVAVNLAYQRFRARGIAPFAAASVDPARVSDNGYDESVGIGVRLGWLTQVTDWLDLGFSWQSRTYMGDLDKYRGLFAGGGEFDVPENYVLGAALHVNDDLTVALDWQRILYSDVDAVGNSAFRLFQNGQPLGSDGGPGFGWRDIDVVKLGAVYQATPALTVRAGYSYSEQPIPSRETFFNILAPGVVEQHISAGATWQATPRHAFTLTYVHAFGEWVRGNGSVPPGMPPGFGGGEADIYLKEDIVGLAWHLSL